MKFDVDENNQDHFDQEFQDVLAELNATVAASPDPLEGNLFYHHHATELAVSGPDPSRAAKRRNFCVAVRGKSQLLEVGFNAGHSALMACAANPNLHYTGVDICGLSYIEPCAAIMQHHFGDRFTFHNGNSLEVLPRLSLDDQRYDLFHVDGSHQTATALADVVNCLRLANPAKPAHLLLDDTQLDELAQLFDRFCDAGDLVIDDLDGQWQDAHNVLGRIIAGDHSDGAAASVRATIGDLPLDLRNRATRQRIRVALTERARQLTPRSRSAR